MKNFLKPMNLISTLLLIMPWGFHTSAQNTFEKADSIAVAFDGTYETVEELAQKLTISLSSEKEKARIFFMWIANNVRYDCQKYHNPSSPKFSAPSEEKLIEEINKWKEKQAEKTMRSKKGVCGDYSQLYKALCDAVGLEAVIISGNARDFHKPYRNAHDNSHAWNAVKIENKWYLLDSTWGAGYTDAGVTKFSRRVSPGFFFTPANWFLLNHFPDEEKWQLLDEPISKKDFANQPVINYGQTAYPIKDFAPNAIEKKNEKEIWLLFEDTPQALMVTNKKKKPIKFQRADKDGVVILSFPGSAAGSIIVFGGKSLRSKMEWMAMYEL